MIIKRRDSKQAEIDEITTLLSVPLPMNKKFLIEQELRPIKSGDQGRNGRCPTFDTKNYNR
jgi:hypothetical protein